jgi:hypothetical protein
LEEVDRSPVSDGRKLICRNAKPPPLGTGEGNREAVEGAL